MGGLQQPPVSGQFQDAVKQVFFHTQKILAQENADEAREQGGGNSVAAPARPSIAHYPQWYGCPMPGCQKEFCSVRRALEHLLGSEEKTDDILKGDGGLSLSLSSSSSNCCQHFDVGAWDRILGHCRVQQQQEKLSSGQLPSLGTVLGGCLARKSKTGSGPRKVPTLKELKNRAWKFVYEEICTDSTDWLRAQAQIECFHPVLEPVLRNREMRKKRRILVGKVQALPGGQATPQQTPLPTPLPSPSVGGGVSV